MTTFRGDLLQPSLGNEGKPPRAAPFSTTTGFVSAFFGGPFGALIVAVLNVHRCGRWKVDAFWLAAALMLTLGWSAWLPNTQLYAEWHATVVESLGGSGWRYAERALSLALFGLMYWRHQSEDRAATLFGLKRPSGWIAGIVAVLLGNALSVIMYVFFVRGPV